MAQMVIEKSISFHDQPMLKMNGTDYVVNIEEIEAFIEQCGKFMPLDNVAQFEVLTQEISDTLIDSARGDLTIEQIRPHLLFLREIGFLLKTMLSPVQENNLPI